MSSAYQYKRLGWRGRYDSHKSFDNLHTSYESLVSKSYCSSITPCRSYDTLPTNRYTARRKSYDTRFDTDDESASNRLSRQRYELNTPSNSTYELMRRRSFDNDLRYNPVRRKSFTQPTSRVYESMSNSRLYERRTSLSERNYENGIVQSKTKGYDALEGKPFGHTPAQSMESGLHKCYEKIHGEKINDTTTNKVKSDDVKKIVDNNSSTLQNKNAETVPNKVDEEKTVVVVTLSEKCVPSTTTTTTTSNAIQRKIKTYENLQNVNTNESATSRRRSFIVDRSYSETTAGRRKSYSVQSKSYDTERKKSYEAVSSKNHDAEKEKKCTGTEEVKIAETTTIESTDNNTSKNNYKIETATDKFTENSSKCYKVITISNIEENGLQKNDRATPERQISRSFNSNKTNTDQKNDETNSFQRSKSSDTVKHKNGKTERRKSVDSGYLKSFDVEMQPFTTATTTTAKTTTETATPTGSRTTSTDESTIPTTTSNGSTISTESFQRSKTCIYKSSYTTQLYSSYASEQYKTSFTDSIKVSNDVISVEPIKNLDVEKSSKADTLEPKSFDSGFSTTPTDPANRFDPNPAEHRRQSGINIAEIKVNETITMQNGQNGQEKEYVENGLSSSDQRKSYYKIDDKINRSSESKTIKKRYEEDKNKEYIIDLKLKDQPLSQNNPDITKDLIPNSASNGFHRNGDSNGHHYRNGDRKSISVVSNGAKDSMISNGYKNGNKSNGYDSDKSFHMIQDKITEKLKSLNINRKDKNLQSNCQSNHQQKNHDVTGSIQNNHENNTLNNNSKNHYESKTYNKGQPKSYATAYRNQINRKRDRLLHTEKVSDFEHNGLCLWLALQKIHQGFRKIFHLYFPRDSTLLYRELSNHRVKLFQLQQRGLIEDEDWALIFPNDSNTTDSCNFDLVLMSILIRTVCEYREPKEGWWKVSIVKEGIDTIHFSKIFSICLELSKCKFSINDGMFELMRKRLEKYMTMLYPPNTDSMNMQNIDNNHNEEFFQFSTTKDRAKVLERKVTRVEKLLKAIWWEVPSYASTYVHRSTEMDELFEKRIKMDNFKQDINTSTSSIFALTGPAGIGKTEIARFWAHHYCRKLDGNVIWIDSDNPNNIDTTFVKLAKRLGISLQDKFGKPVIVDGLHHHIYEQFSQRKSLFIFDNVKDDPTLQKIIPYSKQQYPIILITMQSDQQLRRGIVSYELNTFSNEKALKLVEQIADHCDIRDTEKLAEKMNHLPFSMEIASHIISKREISINEFLKQFEKMKNENFEYDHDGSKLIRILVQMCLNGFEHNKHRTCVEDLLCIMSLMDGNKIDMELLLYIDEYSKEDVKAALTDITTYSLIRMRNYHSMNSNKCSFKMHPAIQHAIQKIKLDEYASRNTFHLDGFFEMYHLRKVLDMVDRFRKNENKLTPSYGELWAHHVICIIYTYRQSKAVMSKLEVFKHDIAIFNIQNRHYQSALYILEIFRNFEVSLMVDNEDLLLDTEREYGNCFLMQGNFDAALSVFLKIHAKERDIFEDVQEPTLLTRFHIGICLQYLAISERHNTNGADSSDNLKKPRGTGAMFKREDEKISAALSVFQDVYTKANETLSGRHPLVVTAFHHIGICKYYQGDLSTALKIFLKVSEIVLDLDCEKQPNNLLMEDQFSRIDETSVSKVPSDLAAFEELYARQKDLLGEKHPIALESKSQIAKCLQNVGNFLPALKHFSEIYEELKNQYGEEHPRSLTCREDIGNCLRKTKEFSAAFEIFKDVSRKRYSLLGENHPHTLDSQYETGLCLYYLKEFQAATSILHHVFERKKKILGELHASTLLTKQTYGICIRDSGDTSLASKVLQEVYEKYKIVYGENHPTTLGSKQQIGICYLRQLRFSTAYDILKEIAEKFQNLYGKENLRTLTADYYVSLCLMKLGKFMDALVLLHNICDHLDKLIGLEEPIYLNSAHHLGICLQAQGYLWTAINVFQEVYSLRKNNKSSPSTLCSGHRLGMCCLDIGNHYAARYAFNELYHTLNR